MNNKKLFNQLIAASTISVMSLAAAQAEVTLQVDDNIKVTVINGQSVSTGIFEEPIKSFTLEPGKHVITAKYDRLYILPRDEHDYLRSNNITVTAEMMDNQTYRLAMLNQPEDYNKAREYVKKPTLAVMKGSQIIAQETSLNQDKGLFAGLSSLFGGESAQIENQKAIAAVNSQSSSSTTTNVSGNTISAVSPAANSKPVTQRPSNANADTLDGFMQLWLEASPDEREKIRQWIEK